MRFERDPDKAVRNLLKHGVSFEEAETVFGDPFATSVLDRYHSTQEQRWLTTGVSHLGRLIIVWHTNRGDSVRIIGARLATPSERRTYESGQ